MNELLKKITELIIKYEDDHNIILGCFLTEPNEITYEFNGERFTKIKEEIKKYTKEDTKKMNHMMYFIKESINDLTIELFVMSKYLDDSLFTVLNNHSCYGCNETTFYKSWKYLRKDYSKNNMGDIISFIMQSHGFELEPHPETADWLQLKIKVI